MENILQKIVEYKKIEVSNSKKNTPLKTVKLELRKDTRNFKGALEKDGISLIAEVKKASPSKGIIKEDFNHIKIAKEYEKGGASAISILTDEKFFKGNLSFLKDIQKEVNLPLLRKDFIIDEYQIFEANKNGADAILLIAAILETEKLEEFLQLSHSLNMSTLVEVHNEQELEKVLKTSASIIGINNRNLETFVTDIQTTSELTKKIESENFIIVSESGINSSNDIEMVKKAGVDAVLIGESLMRASSITEKIKELIL